MTSTAHVGMLLAVVGGYALRVFRLGAQELRGDEAFGYFLSVQPLAQILSDTLTLEEPHPVLSYFVQHGWMAFAGHSEFALRYTGVLFSVAAVALLLRLMRAMGLPAGVSIAGGVLLAVSPYAVWHAQDARMYSMSLSLTLASTLLAVVWLQRSTPAAAAGYVLVTLAALHTHYFATFVVLAQNLYVLIQLAGRRLSTRTLWRWSLWQAALWALYLPWLWTVRQILTGYGGNGDSPGPVEAAARAFAVFAAGESVPVWQGPIWAIAGLAAAGLGLAMLASDAQYRPAAWLFGLTLGVPIAAAWYGAQERPIFDERYLAAAAPPFFALAASSLLWLRSSIAGRRPPTWRAVVRWAGPVALGALVLGSALSLAGYYGNPAYSKTRGWRELAAALQRLSACVPIDSVRLAQNYPDPTLWYYFGEEPDHLVLPPLANDAVLAGAEVNQLVEYGVNRVLLIEQPSQEWDATGIAQSALQRAFTEVAVDRSTNWPIRVYLRPHHSAREAATSFVNGVRLQGYALQSEQTMPGGVVAVDLDWDLTDADSREPTKVFVQLIDTEGRLVAQQDQILLPSTSRMPRSDHEGSGSNQVDSYGILVPHAAQSGQYRLIVGLYLPESGDERVPTVSGEDHIALERVSVVSGAPPGCDR